MSKYTKKTLGQAPGTLIHIGEQKTKKITITIIDYDQEHLSIKEIENVAEVFEVIPENKKRWINIEGLHATKLIAQIGEHFKLHPIALENIVNTRQRAEFDDYEEFIHIITKLVYWNNKHTSIETDQVSIVMGNNYMLTFMERKSDVFDPILNRLKNTKSKIRTLGVDYLGYAVLDLIVDNYFVVIEGFEDRLEVLEENLLNHSSQEDLHEIHRLKRDLISLRKSVWPCREVISTLQASDSELLTSDIDIYTKNLHDHIIQVIDIIEALRDIVSGMLDIYLSSVSNEMNKVMKVLTIIATIFIPLTFIAGIYGMNFDTKSPFNMPELGWHYGYFFALGIMAVVAALMVIYFKRKKWF